MFSRSVSSGKMPSALRSSGQKAMPLASERRGEGATSLSPAILTAPVSAPQRAEHQLGALRAAGAEQAAEADGLAGAQRQIERRHDARLAEALDDAGSVRRARAERGARGRCSTCLQFAPEHQRHELRTAGFPPASDADAAAVAQHRQSVGDRINLFEEMRDEDDREALRACRSRTMSSSRAVSAASRLAVGSSSTSTRVSSSSARAIATSCWTAIGIGAERSLDVDVEAEPLEPRARESRAARQSTSPNRAAAGRASDSASPSASGRD